MTMTSATAHKTQSTLSCAQCTPCKTSLPLSFFLTLCTSTCDFLSSGPPPLPRYIRCCLKVLWNSRIFKHTSLKLNIFPVLLAFNVLYVEVDAMPLFLHWVAVAFSACPLFFPTMTQFAFDIVIPFFYQKTLISYQATCSENKSALRGHYVNRKYKPDVSPKIYKQLWGFTVQIEEVLKCFPITNIQRVFYILAPHCRICVNQQGSQLFREQSGTGEKTLDWIFFICILWA